MDHSSLSEIDQQVLIECLLFAGLEARHFGRCTVRGTEQGLCPLQLALPARSVQEWPECDDSRYRMQSSGHAEIGGPGGRETEVGLSYSRLEYKATQGFSIHPSVRGKCRQGHMGGFYSPGPQGLTSLLPHPIGLKSVYCPTQMEKGMRTMVSNFQQQRSERGTQNASGRVATEDKGQRSTQHSRV